MYVWGSSYVFGYQTWPAGNFSVIDHFPSNIIIYIELSIAEFNSRRVSLIIAKIISLKNPLNIPTNHKKNSWLQTLQLWPEIPVINSNNIQHSICRMYSPIEITTSNWLVFYGHNRTGTIRVDPPQKKNTSPGLVASPSRTKVEPLEIEILRRNKTKQTFNCGCVLENIEIYIFFWF